MTGRAFDTPAPLEIISLLSDLRERYDIAEERIVFGSRTLTILKIADTSRLLDAIKPEMFASDERLPYWAELWPSSIELARFFLREENIRGRTVLELGCGLGLAGIAAAAAGANVLFTDYEPDALGFARINAWMNLPPDVWNSSVAFRLLDWRSPGGVDPVDMVVGADVTYERNQFPPVLNLVQKSLKKEGCAVFTDPDRSTGMSFFALAERRGFRVDLHSTAAVPGERKKTVLLGMLQLPQ